MAFPGMLLSGAGRLLELSLAEANTATPAATQLAVTILAHGAGGQQQGGSAVRLLKGQDVFVLLWGGVVSLMPALG